MLLGDRMGMAGWFVLRTVPLGEDSPRRAVAIGGTNHVAADRKDLLDKLKRAHRGYFAQRIVHPDELPEIMTKHTYTGAMGSAYYTLITGIFFVYFGNTIGLTRFQWGIMGSVASVLLLGQIISALILRRLGQRKLFWLVTAMASRITRLAGILAAVVLWHQSSIYAVFVLVGAMWVATFLEAMAFPLWMSWLADIIPEEVHGRFWGWRSAWIALALTCVTVPAGILLDSVPERAKLHTAVAIFVVAAVIGVMDLIIHGTIPEPAMPAREPNPFLDELLAPIRDRGFRPWLTFNACWTFSMTLGGALALLYFMEELEFKNNFLGGTLVLTVLVLAGSILTGRASGRVVDRAGPKRTLFWGHLFWGLLPLFWIFASPRTALVWLGISSILGGAAATAADTAANKLITRFPPPSDRAIYVAVSACVGNLAGGLGVLVAGFVLRGLEHWSWTAWGWTFGAFHLLFVGSLVLRLASAFFLIPRVQDPAASQATP